MEKPNLREAAATIGMSGESLEALEGLLEDPTAWLKASELGRIALAFKDVTEALTEAAKAKAELDMTQNGAKELRENGVLFEWRNPTTRTGLDTPAVKKQYPQERYPHLYKTSDVKGSISLGIDTGKKRGR